MEDSISFIIRRFDCQMATFKQNITPIFGIKQPKDSLFFWQFDAVQLTRYTMVHYLSQPFPKCAPRIPRGPRPVPQSTRGYISVMTSNFTYIFNKRNNVLLKYNR